MCTWEEDSEERRETSLLNMMHSRERHEMPDSNEIAAAIAVNRRRPAKYKNRGKKEQKSFNF